MTYPKARISRSRSRSRNMRKKHLVKSKRNNRSRKSKKTHSRKYRGGDSIETEIERIISAGRAETLKPYTEFAKASYVFNPTETVQMFKNSHAAPLLVKIGTSYGGVRTHWLYRSHTREEFLIQESTAPGDRPIVVYHLNDWMLDQIYDNEEEERSRR